MKIQESLLDSLHHFLMISTLITFFLVILIGKMFVWFFALSAFLYVPILFIFVVSKFTYFPQVAIKLGCIAASSYCILVLLKLLPWSWFILGFIYISGMFAHQIIFADDNFEKPDFAKDHEAEPIVIEKEEVIEVLDKNEIMYRIQSRRKVLLEKKKESIQAEKNTLFLLIDLKEKYISELSFSQNKILNEIQEVFAGLQQKINQNHEIKIEIENVLKIALEQLQDLIVQYIKCPKNLRYYPSEKYVSSPQEYLVQQLKTMLDQLIEVAEILYREDLESMILHSQYLQKQLKPDHFFKVGRNVESS